MRKIRQRYYDLFSKFYDRFIELHAPGKGEYLRTALSDKVEAGGDDIILDLCTGTGILLRHLSGKLTAGGMVIGVDFSTGMLRKAGENTRDAGNIFLVQADVGRLPFKNGIFDTITCSQAFYELKGEEGRNCLREIKRTLKAGKSFLMMEHDLPATALKKILFFIRLLSLGSARALMVLRHEKEMLGAFFGSVEKTNLPALGVKIYKCKS